MTANDGFTLHRRLLYCGTVGRGPHLFLSIFLTPVPLNVAVLFLEAGPESGLLLHHSTRNVPRSPGIMVAFQHTCPAGGQLRYEKEKSSYLIPQRNSTSTSVASLT